MLLKYRKKNHPQDIIPCIHLFNGYIKPTIKNDSWQIELFIPIDFIKKVYNTTLPIPNHFKGNVNKCGFNEIAKHAGSWNKIDSPDPVFHTPQFFGDFYIRTS